MTNEEGITGLYFGGFVGAIYDRGKQLPLSMFAFPVYTVSTSLSVGPKVEYINQINKTISLFLSGQIGLIEFGRVTEKRDDPQLPESAQSSHDTYFDFAKRTNFNVGFTIAL